MPDSDLEIQQSVEGTPMPLHDGESLNLGYYSPGQGKTWEFFIKNTTDKFQANITEYKMEEDGAVIEGPKIIIPGESAKIIIRILPNPDITEDIKLEDMPKDNFHIKWTTHWTNFISRFEQ